jgi:hypothetical protein
MQALVPIVHPILTAMAEGIGDNNEYGKIQRKQCFGWWEIGFSICFQYFAVVSPRFHDESTMNRGPTPIPKNDIDVPPIRIKIDSLARHVRPY